MRARSDPIEVMQARAADIASATMENPYLEKVTRAIDERVDRPADELQALALVAIAIELQAIRLHLERDHDGIVIG